MTACFRYVEERQHEYDILAYVSRVVNQTNALGTSTEPSPPSKQEHTNLFFLKMHKCGSSTIQNILMRFGYSRNLDFVLPYTHNYIGNPAVFSSNMIQEDLRTPNNKYNIFAHHTRFSEAGVRKVMHNGTTFVTVLRNPADVYESLFTYYNFQKVFNVTFEEILKSPANTKKITRRFYNRLGFNQMSWDLGMEEKYFKSPKYIEEFIERTDKTFDLVMISEWMEVSLILLCDLMNWPLENVVFLTLNSRPDALRHHVTERDRKTLRQINSADAQLYDYFLRKFKDKIIEYGEERMTNDLMKLLMMNNNLKFRCVENQNTRGYGHTTAYQLRQLSFNDWTCVYATKSELGFTDELRQYQKAKRNIYMKLRTLLDET